MTIIDEIKLYVKHGKLPIVQDISKNYCVVIIDNNQQVVKISDWEKTTENLQIGDDNAIYNNEEIKSKNWHIVGQFDLPLVPFAVGQKVKVREDLADVYDVRDWMSKYKNMIGKIYKIDTVHNEDQGLYYSLEYDKKSTFRHDWLLPVLETKRTVDDVLAGLSDEDKEIIKERLE
jgi:hypothetical protein